jgi:hypothetical protein
MRALRLLEKFFRCSRNQFLSLVGEAHQGVNTRIQDFALGKVSYQLTAGNPPSLAKAFVQASSPQDYALAVHHVCDPQVPTQWPQGLGMRKKNADYLPPYPIRISYQLT